MGGTKTLVVGSGAGGLTLALLLAKAGREVELIECQPQIGGYLRRFTRKGIRLDTGFHFSGGFNGVMSQMLEVLGISDSIRSAAIPNDIVLNASGERILLPGGIGFDGVAEVFRKHFPKEREALKTLFGSIREIWTETQMRDLDDLSPLDFDLSRFDTMTVREYCARLGLTPAAETAAASFAVCHGTPLSLAPMSFHARVGFSLYDDLSRVETGGDAFIRAFERELLRYGVKIRTSAELLPFSGPDSQGECREVRFADGSSLCADQIFFTVHPLAVRKLLPERVLSPSFLRRMNRLRETNSFFCAYFLADDDVEIPQGLVSVFSQNDLDRILEGDGWSTGCLIGREPDCSGKLRTTAAAFRTMPAASAPGKPHRERLHDAEYQEFKERTAASIESELTQCYPQLKGHLTLLECGSPLTCLDYDPPTGSAYGVRCVCGQSRILGRLPVANCFLAGQSAMVPGVMGTMLTSFTVFRMAVGEDIYRRVIQRSE